MLTLQCLTGKYAGDRIPTDLNFRQIWISRQIKIRTDLKFARILRKYSTKFRQIKVDISRNQHLLLLLTQTKRYKVPDKERKLS